MELIDAQALYSEIDALGGCDAKEEWAQGYDEGVAAALDVFEKAPTIEAEPVRHGRWIGGNALDTCSECGGLGADCFAYCPQCGAKMDGGAENGNCTPDK